MVKGGGFVSMIFMLMMLLSPPGVSAENKGLFDGQQFTKQIRLELKVAKVTKHPLLTRKPLDYLAEGGRKYTEDKESEFYRCKEKPALTNEAALADIAKEVALAPDEQIKKFFETRKEDILATIKERKVFTFLKEKANIA